MKRNHTTGASIAGTHTGSTKAGIAGRRTKAGALAMAFACILLLPRLLAAQSVTLAWDANTETDLAGYKIYYGRTTRTYGTPVTLGKVTTHTLALASGVWYFAATAYNATGLESGYSNEVTTTLAAPCDLNGDGVVNVLDVQTLTNNVLKGVATGDINKDGAVNVLDIQLLVNIILGKATCPP